MIVVLGVLTVIALTVILIGFTLAMVMILSSICLDLIEENSDIIFRMRAAWDKYHNHDRVITKDEYDNWTFLVQETTDKMKKLAASLDALEDERENNE